MRAALVFLVLLISACGGNSDDATPKPTPTAAALFVEISGRLDGNPNPRELQDDLNTLIEFYGMSHLLGYLEEVIDAYGLEGDQREDGVYIAISAEIERLGREHDMPPMKILSSAADHADWGGEQYLFDFLGTMSFYLLANP